MRIGYWELWTGLSGDMFVGALIDAGFPEERLRRGIAQLKLGPFGLAVERRRHQGFTGTGITVTPPAHPPHRGFRDIRALLEASELAEPVRVRSLEVFRRLGEAEARIHGCALEDVHFHEIGAFDSIVDIVGSVLGVHELGLEENLAGAIPVTTGTITMDHGKVPSPAPATSLLLPGWPVRPSPLEGELFTPTAAALLSVLARPAPGIPAMRVEAIGFGAGTKVVPAVPNLVRLWIGERSASSEEASLPPLEEMQLGRVTILETQIDDLDPRHLAVLCEDLLDQGALDVFRASVVMKKGRMGVLLTVVARPEHADRLVHLLVSGSTTLGVRRRDEMRHELSRRSELVETSLGPVRVKRALFPDGERTAIEHADLVRLSRRHGIGLVVLETRLRHEIEGMPPEPPPRSPQG